MNWILDNLEKLVPVVITILYFVGSSKAKKVEEGRGKADPDAADRSRRIQEEIRHKILGRQQQGKPVARSGAPEQPYIPEPEFEEGYDPFEPEVDQSGGELVFFPEEEVPAPPPKFASPDELFEKQREKIEEQMQKARDLRKQMLGVHGKQVSAVSRKSGIGEIGDLREALLNDLKNPNSIRRAIVIKEILDTPLALR